MRRVLIVSPHFPPVNAPDMQRARLALPHLRDLGWEAVVLAVTPEFVEGAVNEPLLEKTYPADTRIIRVRGLSARFTRPLGFGSLWWRCGRALRRAGDALLATEKFDLVFFTTTQFDAFTLGPRWLARFGVPYALDYQDPWVNDYYARNRVRPPGGPLRYWLSQYTAKAREPAAFRAAAAVVAVSPAYLADLVLRYPDARPTVTEVLPFPSAASDFEIARAHPPEHPLIPFGDGSFHIVYTGRGGPDMARALRILFRALRARIDAASTGSARPIKLHFIGTDYAPAPLAKPSVLPIAREEGVSGHVSEHCGRVPYFEALHYLAKADAILVIGSDDAAYNASKLRPCMLARRPLLCLAHHASPLFSAARQASPESTFGFGGDASDAACADRIARAWLAHPPANPPAPETTFARLADSSSAHTMTRRLCEIFDLAVNANHPSQASR
ncbi:MAG: hypothetical protein MUE42_07295 [Opitutaceae bacterium]|jgi:hypothetical protein|nr:hypothetical protein [Opitutaceae bacterium]